MINFGSGLQRIYLVVSIGWIVIFLFMAFDDLGDKYTRDKTSLRIDGKTCQELWTDAPKFKIIDKIGYSDYIVRPDKDKTKIFQSYQGIQGVTFPFCTIVFKNTLLERLNYYNKKFFYIAIVPIPLYFLLLFIIDGFKQPNTKVNKKRKIK